MGRILASVLGAATLALMAGGCGGGGDTTITSTAASTTSTISQQDLNAARHEGAQQARVQAKLHNLEQKVKNQGSSGSTTTVQATTPPPTPTTSGTATVGNSDCGNGISTGPHTSCPFATNVRSAYYGAGGGDITITAFSPVTGQSYTMNCIVGENTHVCTGPDNIAVYF